MHYYAIWRSLFIIDNGWKRKKDDLYFEFLLKMYGYEATHTHTRLWYEKAKFVFFRCSSWFPLYNFGYEKYEITIRGMKKANLWFLDFVCDFPNEFLGMQRMRIPLHTRLWYESGKFVVFSFLSRFPL